MKNRYYKIYSSFTPLLLALIFWGAGMPFWSVIVLTVMAVPGVINVFLTRGYSDV